MTETIGRDVGAVRMLEPAAIGRDVIRDSFVTETVGRDVKKDALEAQNDD